MSNAPILKVNADGTLANFRPLWPVMDFTALADPTTTIGVGALPTNPGSVTSPISFISGLPWTGGDFGNAVFAPPGAAGPFSKDPATGALAIAASITSAPGVTPVTWQTGCISAAAPSGKMFGAQYGYFEALMKLPGGPGVWPGFWLETTTAANRPLLQPSIEIDVIEYHGNNPGTTTNTHFSSSRWVHYVSPSGPATQVLQITPVAADWVAQDFHYYGVQVAADVTTIYLDRVAIWSFETPRELTGWLYPIIDNAIGSGFPLTNTPNPSVLLVKSLGIYTPH